MKNDDEIEIIGVVQHPRDSLSGTFMQQRFVNNMQIVENKVAMSPREPSLIAEVAEADIIHSDHPIRKRKRDEELSALQPPLAYRAAMPDALVQDPISVYEAEARALKIARAQELRVEMAARNLLLRSTPSSSYLSGAGLASSLSPPPSYLAPSAAASYLSPYAAVVPPPLTHHHSALASAYELEREHQLRTQIAASQMSSLSHRHLLLSSEVEALRAVRESQNNHLLVDPSMGTTTGGSLLPTSTAAARAYALSAARAREAALNSQLSSLQEGETLQAEAAHAEALRAASAREAALRSAPSLQEGELLRAEAARAEALRAASAREAALRSAPSLQEGEMLRAEAARAEALRAASLREAALRRQLSLQEGETLRAEAAHAEALRAASLREAALNRRLSLQQEGEMALNSPPPSLQEGEILRAEAARAEALRAASLREAALKNQPSLEEQAKVEEILRAEAARAEALRAAAAREAALKSKQSLQEEATKGETLRAEADQAKAARAAAAREYALKSQPSLQEATREETHGAVAKSKKRRGRPPKNLTTDAPFTKNRRQPKQKTKLMKNEAVLRAEFHSLPPSLQAFVFAEASRMRGDKVPTSASKKTIPPAVPSTTKIGRQPSAKQRKENELIAESRSMPSSVAAKAVAVPSKMRAPVPTTTRIIRRSLSPKEMKESELRAEFHSLPPSVAAEVVEVPSKRKRGRPRKNVVPTVAAPPVPTTTTKITRRQLSPKEMKEQKLRAEFYSLPPSVAAEVLAVASKRKAPVPTSASKTTRAPVPNIITNIGGRQLSAKEMKEGQLRAEFRSCPPMVAAEVVLVAPETSAPVPTTIGKIRRQPSAKEMKEVLRAEAAHAEELRAASLREAALKNQPSLEEQAKVEEILLQAEAARAEALRATAAREAALKSKQSLQEEATKGETLQAEADQAKAAAAREYALKSQPSLQEATREEIHGAAKSKKRRGRPPKNVTTDAPFPTTTKNRRQPKQKTKLMKNEAVLRAEFHLLPPSLQAFVFAEASRNRAHKK